MKISPAAWLRQIWPSAANKRAVVADYAGLSQHPHLLTDIALRGRVWSALEARDENGAVDPAATYINLGRRELALEILELAGMSPQQLWSLVERSPTPEKRDAA